MIAIVDTGGANLSSIQDAFQRLGQESCVTLDKSVLDSASHLILPGVGHAKFAMERLKSSDLDLYIKAQIKPVLGICLGMQLMYDFSNEGDVETLGLISGTVQRIKPNPNFSVPHMGWCQLVPGQGFCRPTKASPLGPVYVSNASNFDFESKLLQGLTSNDYFYFVHSFQGPEESQNTSAYAKYESQKIPAVIEYKNFYGVQFHPEKSADAGAKILKNFINLNEGLS